MTTQELRAAAERLMRFRRGENYSNIWDEDDYTSKGCMSDRCLVVDAYLAQMEAEEQQAADGALPVDEEWWEETFTERDIQVFTYHCNIWITPEGFYAGGNIQMKWKNRQHALDLVRALGVGQ